MSTLKSIALFGGSFNPPHWAHHQVLEYLRGLPQFSQVWMMPVYTHPFEKDLAPFADRLEMCRLTIKGLEPSVVVCSIEGELKRNPSYTIDTLRALKSRYPDSNFTLIVGSDVKSDLFRWKDSEALKKETSFFFIPRPGFEASPFLDISSSQIRHLIRDGKDVSKYLVPEVRAYIAQHGLYGGRAGTKSPGPLF